MSYDTAQIRKLLQAAFTDEELTIFCYDHFRPVHTQFAVSMGLLSKTQALIVHCEKHDEFDKLLRLVQESNPNQYQKFEPFKKGAAARPRPDPQIQPKPTFRLGENPFFNRSAIRDLNYFWGRRLEVQRLLEFVSKGQSVSVVGQRRIGKTSLLFYASRPATLQSFGLNPNQFVFTRIDCEGRGNLAEDDFYRLMLRELAREIGLSRQWSDILDDAAAAGLAVFEEGIMRARADERRLIFLLDEFEIMAANQRLSPEFFAVLRRLAGDHAIAYVTVTKSPLLALTAASQSVLSSPFFGFFQPLQLGLFTADEAREMIKTLAAGAGLPFPNAGIVCIDTLAGQHPLLLQLAAYYAFAQLQSQVGQSKTVDCPLIREQFWTDAVSHFEYYWRNLDTEARYVLATLPLNTSANNETLAALAEQCLVVRRGSAYVYLSIAFRDFVRGQTLPGLAQIGPFLIDQGRQAVIYNDRPIQLTPTQYKVFNYLIERPGQVAEFDKLEENVWGDALIGDSERLKAAIKHLRRALGKGAKHIQNVRGVGYKFELLP